MIGRMYEMRAPFPHQPACSATEFDTTVLDPITKALTYGLDVQEGVLNHLNGDYIGAVYTADLGALSTGVQIQNSSPDASWQYAIKYAKTTAAGTNVLFSVDGLGNIGKQLPDTRSFQRGRSVVSGLSVRLRPANEDPGSFGD